MAQGPSYSIDTLRSDVEKSKVNISAIEQGLVAERKTITDYEAMIRDAENGKKTEFPVEGLRNGIESAKSNIADLEKGIEKERSAIASNKIMIDDLQQAQKDHEEAARLSRVIEVQR